MPFKVLLTGGPCGGKSTILKEAISILRNTHPKLVVNFVPEVATNVFRCLHSFSAPKTADERVRLQTALLKKQIQDENTILELGGANDIVFFDRGAIDGKTFMKGEEWQQVLTECNVNEKDLFERYDLVIHCTSVAVDCPCLYAQGPHSNNENRYHNVEQARNADLRGQEIFKKHPRSFVIHNDDENGLQGKVRRAMDIIMTELADGVREIRGQKPK